MKIADLKNKESEIDAFLNSFIEEFYSKCMADLEAEEKPKVIGGLASWLIESLVCVALNDEPNLTDEMLPSYEGNTIEASLDIIDAIRLIFKERLAEHKEAANEAE